MIGYRYISPEEMESITAQVLQKSDMPAFWNG